MQVIITIITDTEWIATYGGGAYIDIHHASDPDTAVDAINVWNYATDAPTIPLTADAIIAKVSEWEAESGEECLNHVVLFGR